LEGTKRAKKNVKKKEKSWGAKAIPETRKGKSHCYEETEGVGMGGFLKTVIFALGHACVYEATRGWEKGLLTVERGPPRICYSAALHK